MCGCRGDEAWDGSDEHDQKCECSCHRGIVNPGYRCNVITLRFGDRYACSRSVGHDGDHKGYGIGHPPAEVTWPTRDDAKTDAALIKEGQCRPTTVQDFPQDFLGHFRIGRGPDKMTEAMVEAAAASANLAAAWKRFWDAVQAIEEMNRDSHAVQAVKENHPK